MPAVMERPFQPQPGDNVKMRANTNASGYPKKATVSRVSDTEVVLNKNIGVPRNIFSKVYEPAN